jgi:hypothetical protein
VCVRPCAFSEKTLAELSRELDISPKVIRNWRGLGDRKNGFVLVRRVRAVTTYSKSNIWLLLAIARRRRHYAVRARRGSRDYRADATVLRHIGR